MGRDVRWDAEEETGERERLKEMELCIEMTISDCAFVAGETPARVHRRRRCRRVHGCVDAISIEVDAWMCMCNERSEALCVVTDDGEMS
jgi:hypothetical protein